MIYGPQLQGGYMQPRCTWDETLTQLMSLPASNSQTALALLAWQAMIYALWIERNSRLHSNTFKSVDTLFVTLDRQIRNKTHSFRHANPRSSSQMLQN